MIKELVILLLIAAGWPYRMLTIYDLAFGTLATSLGKTSTLAYDRETVVSQ